MQARQGQVPRQLQAPPDRRFRAVQVQTYPEARVLPSESGEAWAASRRCNRSKMLETWPLIKASTSAWLWS